MDPDEALKQIRAVVVRILNGEQGDEALAEDADELAGLVDGLDNWISGGGFLPAAWPTISTQALHDLSESPAGPRP